MKFLGGLYKKISDFWWLASCLFVSGSIQLSFISKSSIWHDEGYSLLLAPQTIADIITRTARDVHPPLYYIKLHFWLELLGNSEVAARSFSVVCILGAIVFTFLIIRRLFGSASARTAAVFLAVAPFLIRYGQEARMYAMVALLVCLASYLLVLALDRQNSKWLYLYALIMALAFYTHYYAVFMVPVHWLYVASRTRWRNHNGKQKKLDMLNANWWLANILIVILFAPWLPVAYAQFTRVQGGFWIPPVDIDTLPATFGQLIYFTSLNSLATWLKLGILGSGILLVGVTLWRNRQDKSSLLLLITWAAFTPLFIYVLSLISRPIYIDRYFVYVAFAFYGLLAVILYQKPLNVLAKVRPIIIVLVVGLFGFGIRNVYLQSTHSMRQTGQALSAQFTNGDALVAGELYVYLDFSYYNNTNTELRLYAPGGVSGYGETSLFYDNQSRIVVNDLKSLKPATNRVWIIGKAGDKTYYQEVPQNWVQDAYIQNGESVARRYQLTN